jgi:hypothetical protein
MSKMCKPSLTWKQISIYVFGLTVILGSIWFGPRPGLEAEILKFNVWEANKSI